jgi:hypothetical protein
MPEFIQFSKNSKLKVEGPTISSRLPLNSVVLFHPEFLTAPELLSDPGELQDSDCRPNQMLTHLPQNMDSFV